MDRQDEQDHLITNILSILSIHANFGMRMSSH